MDSGSSTPWTAYDPADLTGKARIHDAAIAHFAGHGFAAASLRGIAEAANVSAGLVRHHFGSKDGLRQACGAYALEFLRRGASP
jgi:AcrR family transcriptional regulator